VIRRFVTVVLVLATIDLATKSMAHDAGIMEPVRNPGLALGVIDVGTGAELALMLVGLFGGGMWLLRRAAVGKGRLLTAVFVVGGAASNLADRLVYGSVRDFIPTPWAVFNLADVFLVAGVVLIYSELLRGSDRTAMEVAGAVSSKVHGL
jgi:signal peptidase II